METETTHWTFCTFFIKTHYPFEIRMYFLTDAWFGNITPWAFWKYWLVNWHRCSECGHISLPGINNFPSLLVSWETSVKCGQADKLPVAFTGFYNVLFFNLESLDFIIGYEYCQLFSKLTLLILKNMWPKSPSLNKYSLFVLASCVFKQKLWYETKADSSARNSITLQLIKALSTYFSFCQLDY